MIVTPTMDQSEMKEAGERLLHQPWISLRWERSERDSYTNHGSVGDGRGRRKILTPTMDQSEIGEAGERLLHKPWISLIWERPERDCYTNHGSV